MSQNNRLRGENHPRAKLTNEQVRKIRELYNSGFSHKLIARNFKISTWNVKEIGEGITWKHLL